MASACLNTAVASTFQLAPRAYLPFPSLVANPDVLSIAQSLCSNFSFGDVEAHPELDRFSGRIPNHQPLGAVADGNKLMWVNHRVTPRYHTAILLHESLHAICGDTLRKGAPTEADAEREISTEIAAFLIAEELGLPCHEFSLAYVRRRTEAFPAFDSARCVIEARARYMAGMNVFAGRLDIAA